MFPGRFSSFSGTFATKSQRIGPRQEPWCNPSVAVGMKSIYEDVPLGQVRADEPSYVTRVVVDCSCVRMSRHSKLSKAL